MVSGRFAHGAHGHEQSLAVIQAAKAAHPRRQGMKILEHPVLQCMPRLVDAQPPALPEHGAQLPANPVGRALLQDMARVTNGESHRVLRQWAVLYGPLADAAVAWLVWAPLAKALAQGTWHADVTQRFRRSDMGQSLEAPVVP